MNSFEVESLYSNLKKLLSEGKFLDKNITIFGANKPADLTIQFLMENNIEVSAIIDNNIKKQGQIKFGVKVYSIEEYFKEYNDYNIILIASQYYNEMSEQLEKRGYKKEKHIFQTIKFNEFTIVYSKFKEKINQVLNGMNLYEELKSKYGEDVNIFISPCSGLGDVNMIGLYLFEYCKEFEIQNYILTVVGKGSEKVARMFDINNIVMLTQQQSDNLVELCAFMGEEKCNIKVLLHMYQHIDILSKFELYNFFSWEELYRFALFKIKDKNAKKININYRVDIIEELFEKNLLIKGRTIILAPYAASLVSIPDVIWESIARIFIENGYKVCTNCFGKSEYPIKGTIPISFSVEDAVAVLEYAGGFIGLRSGLCDIMCYAKAKKIVIYPDENSSNFYGLQNIGVYDDVNELVFHDKYEKKLIKEIVGVFNVKNIL